MALIEIEINFREQAHLDRAAREGWGPAEPMGAWMIGPISRVVLPPPPRHDGDFELRAVIGPKIVPGVVDSQPFRISVNGHVVFDRSIDQVWSVVCAVPAEVIGARAQVEIVIEHPDAIEPAGTGPGADMRKLAGGIWNLTIIGTSPLPAERAPMFGRPVMMIRQGGNLANRMLQYMLGLSVQARAPNCILAGIELPEWDIRTQPDDGTWADLALDDESLADDTLIDIEATAALLREQTVRKIVHRGFGRKLSTFLPREHYADVFKPRRPDIAGFDARHLVMNVRSGDVVSGQFSEYVLTPLNFYRDLIALTGLIPVFMGQLEPNAYTDALRAAFPNAVYHESLGPIGDFETIRRSKNIVVSISTFSWLAAWLSEAEQIFLPVNGMFNPLQYRPVNLLPFGDPRYRYYLFPTNHAAADFAAAHAAIDGQWREVSAAELADMLGTDAARSTLAAPAPAVPSEAVPPPPPPSLPMHASAPMLEDVRAVAVLAEEAGGRGHVVDVLHHLRHLSLTDFASLIWSLPRADLPNISALLPRMAPASVQLGWNGTQGEELRNLSVDFCRIVAGHFQQITGRSMDHARVMDFGCGWGRLTRMLYYYTDPQNCCAVDAMGEAVERCRTDGLLGRLVRSSYIPDDIDVGERRYDLIFAYSVFTHTPPRVAQVILSTLRRKLRGNGLLAITVRPVEFWAQNGSSTPAQNLALARAHRETGFAFHPLGVVADNGEDTYGETSMTPAWLAANFPDWEVEGTDRGLDPMQMIVFLTPR